MAGRPGPRTARGDGEWRGRLALFRGSYDWYANLKRALGAESVAALNVYGCDVPRMRIVISNPSESGSDNDGVKAFNALFGIPGG